MKQPFSERIAREIDVEIEQRVKKCLSMTRLIEKDGEVGNPTITGYNTAVREQRRKIAEFLKVTGIELTAGNFHVPERL